MLPSADPRRIHRQLREYLRSLGWVLRDGVRLHAKQAVVIAIVNLFGVVAGSASLGGIVTLAKHAGHPQTLHFAGLRIHLSGDIGSLLLFATGLALIGLFSGFCL